MAPIWMLYGDPDDVARAAQQLRSCRSLLQADVPTVLTSTTWYDSHMMGCLRHASGLATAPVQPHVGGSEAGLRLASRPVPVRAHPAPREGSRGLRTGRRPFRRHRGVYWRPSCYDQEHQLHGGYRASHSHFAVDGDQSDSRSFPCAATHDGILSNSDSDDKPHDSDVDPEHTTDLQNTADSATETECKNVELQSASPPSPIVEAHVSTTLASSPCTSPRPSSPPVGSTSLPSCESELLSQPDVIDDSDDVSHILNHICKTDDGYDGIVDNVLDAQNASAENFEVIFDMLSFAEAKMFAKYHGNRPDSKSGVENLYKKLRALSSCRIDRSYEALLKLEPKDKKVWARMRKAAARHFNEHLNAEEAADLSSYLQPKVVKTKKDPGRLKFKGVTQR
eukprot:TRINITY_DN29475_c0_g1_i2.p1 TRINITY_DN29475_c0_g1~~TRINITY_DN29475_c0_g1_i2.p1  ORF type:complete len:394 (+),score=50.50 TRINITY_DN29475_c0_g1_i2:82-1263(+)